MAAIVYAAPGDCDKDGNRSDHVYYRYDADGNYDYDYDYNYDYDYDYNFDNQSSICGLSRYDDHTSFKIKDGDLLIIHDSWRDDVVKITEDGGLYINDEHIITTANQTELLKKYYDKTMDLTKQAKKLGTKSAVIGITSAKIGLKAAANALSMAFSDADCEELEDEIDAESDRIEAEADKIEDDADRISDIADELDDMADQLKVEIHELDELSWF